MDRADIPTNGAFELESPPGDSRPVGPSSDTGHPLASTVQLIESARGGNIEARELLVARFLPLLRRWAHGRLPRPARGMIDTDDLVQITLMRALNSLEDFEHRREGAFIAYLRRIVINAVRDELRRTGRRPKGDELVDDLVDTAPSLVEEAIGRELVERYEAALSHLEEGQQEAVILRIEFGYTYPEIAEAIGAPSANAARMTVTRALSRLAGTMGRG